VRPRATSRPTSESTSLGFETTTRLAPNFDLEAPEALVEETVRCLGALGTNGTTALCVVASRLLSLQLRRRGFAPRVVSVDYDNRDSDDDRLRGIFGHVYVTVGDWGCDPSRLQFDRDAPVVFRLPDSRYLPLTKIAMPEALRDVEVGDWDLVQALAGAAPDQFTVEELPEVLAFVGLEEFAGPVLRLVEGCPGNLCMACDQPKRFSARMRHPDHPDEEHMRQACARHASEILKLDPAATSTAARSAAGVGRNEPCPCGSGSKYKRCCGR
jgi:hypothetical protein